MPTKVRRVFGHKSLTVAITLINDMYKKINQKWKTPKKDSKRSPWLKPQTLLTLATTLIKKINEKMKKHQKKTLKKSLTKTTNFVMMMLDYHYHPPTFVGPTAAETDFKLQQLNPFRLTKILWTICEFAL